jgi:tRNA1(Val) A37 N6-methylase TrmN6
MIAENYSPSEKKAIADQIKLITIDEVENEMNKLIEIATEPFAVYTISSRSQLGNNVVDYFTFIERLETRGKYDVNYFEFIKNIEEFKKKKFIQNMLKYYEEVKNKNNTKNKYKVLKEVYNICISAINILRPLNWIEVYKKYGTQKALNFCTGWGGSAVAAAALNLKEFNGIEINTNLEPRYAEMLSYLRTKCATKLNIHSQDALTFDYSTIEYDTVFTSPPYYFIQKYSNNTKYASKKEMDEKFYKPVFTLTYNGLKPGGNYLINVCKEVYDNVLINLFGPAHEIFSLKKSKRQNDYNEIVYVWKKPNILN